MYGGSNAMLEKCTLHRVPVRHSKHVLVEDMPTIGSPLRARNAGFFQGAVRQGAVIGVGDSPAPQIVGIQTLELYSQDCRLWIEKTPSAPKSG
jgi:hypothetical protein